MSHTLARSFAQCLKRGWVHTGSLGALARGSALSRGYSDQVKGAQAAEENRRARRELAASYRILERLSMGEGICNHLTLMAPAADGSGNDVMLLIPHGIHWSEVRASDLLGFSEEGQMVEGEGHGELTACCIHQGVRRGAAHRHRCVFHTHPPYTTALGCLKNPRLLMLHQTSMRFRNNVAYDTEFPGYGDSMEEGTRLGQQLGDKEVLIMGNHGVLTARDSPAWCFDLMYYMERVAMTQILALSTGQEIKELSEDIILGAQKYVQENLDEYAQKHFNAHVRLLDRDCPEYAL